MEIKDYVPLRKGMINFFNDIENLMRNLEGLGISSEDYG